MTSEQMLPRLSANNIADSGYAYTVLGGQFLQRIISIIFSYLSDLGIRKFALVMSLTNLLSASLYHVVRVLQGCSFDDVSWVYTSRNVACVAALGGRPVSIGKEKPQSMRSDILAIVVTIAIATRPNRKRPNQAIVGIVICDGVLEPNPVRFGWCKLAVGHLRSFIATVLSRVRFSERPGFSIISEGL